MENLNLYIIGLILLIIIGLLIYWFVIRDTNQPNPTPTNSSGNFTIPSLESFTEILPCETNNYYKSTGRTSAPGEPVLTDEECNNKYKSKISFVNRFSCYDPRLHPSEGCEDDIPIPQHLYISEIWKDYIMKSNSDEKYVESLREMFEQTFNGTHEFYRTEKLKKDILRSVQIFVPEIKSLEYLTKKENVKKYLKKAFENNKKFNIIDKDGNIIKKFTEQNIININNYLGTEYSTPYEIFPYNTGEQVDISTGEITDCGVQFKLPVGNECNLIFNINNAEV